MKTAFAITAIVLIAVAIAVAFAGSCFITASDGQGAFVFLVSIPVMLALISVGFYLIAILPPGLAARAILFFVLAGQSLILIVFVLGAFIAPLRAFPEAVVGRVAETWVAMTGFTPYTWVRRNRKLAVQINHDLAASGDAIAVGEISPGRPWKRV